jgi:hypothetical protein
MIASLAVNIYSAISKYRLNKPKKISGDPVYSFEELKGMIFKASLNEMSDILSYLRYEESFSYEEMDKIHDLIRTRLTFIKISK